MLVFFFSLSLFFEGEGGSVLMHLLFQVNFKIYFDELLKEIPLRF